MESTRKEGRKRRRNGGSEVRIERKWERIVKGINDTDQSFQNALSIH